MFGKLSAIFQSRSEEDTMARSPEHGREERRPNFLTPTTMVTIMVREDEQEDAEKFEIHKNFAVYYSPYFKAALDGGFVEGETQTINFTADPKVFSLLVTWIYSQKIQFAEDHHPRSASLIQLWILADYLQIPSLQNQVIDHYYALSMAQGPNHGPSLGAGWSARSVYESTAEGSPLRRLLVLHFAIFAEQKGLEGDKIKQMFPQELFVDIAVCLAGLKDDVQASQFSCAERVWDNLDLQEFYVDEEVQLEARGAIGMQQ